jgi:hypothetical protein
MKRKLKTWNKERRECKHCEKFHALGRYCTAKSHGECDCPKCQGFCECKGVKR